jgi:cofilin
MNVGTNVSDDCVTEFNSLKLGKHYRYVIYKLDKETNSVL